MALLYAMCMLLGDQGRAHEDTASWSKIETISTERFKSDRCEGAEDAWADDSMSTSIMKSRVHTSGHDDHDVIKSVYV